MWQNNHELTLQELSEFGLNESEVKFIKDNDYHVVSYPSWLSIWRNYILCGVIAKWNCEQLSDWIGEKENEQNIRR